MKFSTIFSTLLTAAIAAQASLTPGSEITVTLGGKSYSGVVGSDGTWSAAISPLDLAQLPDDNVELTVTSTDAPGNTGSGL